MEINPPDDDYHQSLFLLLDAVQVHLSADVVYAAIAVLILLVFSALISGSEAAFFSLTPQEIDDVKEDKTKKGEMLTRLIARPRYLLSTILISNNFINIGIVITSYFAVHLLFHFPEAQAWLAFLIDGVLVTFLLVLFGEVIPKIYANQSKYWFINIMGYPLFFLSKIVYPLSYVMVSSTKVIEKRLHSEDAEKVSLEQIEHAIDITADEQVSQQERNILKLSLIHI